VCEVRLQAVEEGEGFMRKALGMRATDVGAVLGVTPETSERTADHLIVVTDLRRKR
jgi:hypothetical protein